MPYKRIVFLTHDASLTGAPILLLNLIKLLKTSAETEFEIILVRGGGDLESDFRKLGKVYVLKHSNYGKRSSELLKLIDFLILQIRYIPVYFAIAKSDLIFNNTIANGRVLKKLSFLRKPVASYLHEMKNTIDSFQKNNDSALSFKYSNLFFSPSGSVTEHLKTYFGVESTRIFPLDYYFAHKRVDFPASRKADAKRHIADKYNVDPGQFWVVGMGTATERKGIDKFVEVCYKVSSKVESITFFWIGEFLDLSYQAKIKSMISSYGIEKKLIFTGKLPNNPALLLPFDLFALTSREDPYPLVVLEAAYNRIPSICFAHSGGIVDFVENDAGWIVNDFSNEEMCQIILETNFDRKLIEQKGYRAYDKVNEKHSDGERILIQLIDGLNILNISANAT